MGGGLGFVKLRVSLCFVTRFHIIYCEFALYGRAPSAGAAWQWRVSVVVQGKQVFTVKDISGGRRVQGHVARMGSCSDASSLSSRATDELRRMWWSVLIADLTQVWQRCATSAHWTRMDGDFHYSANSPEFAARNIKKYHVRRNPRLRHHTIGASP